MPTFKTATVSSIEATRDGLQRVTVDGEPAYVLTRLIGAVAVGDRVVVNTTAVDLGLGTGGAHVVHWNLARDQWSEPGPGHIMKLRYTSLQADTGAAEEGLGDALPSGLAGMPVVACGLHSQMAIAAVALKEHRPAARVVYVMTDGGALPLALSDLVADLCEAGVLDATVSAGQAFGGDHEAVNIFSGLLVARAIGADAVVAGIGPGVVGTGTAFGHTGLDVTQIVNAAAALGGRPIVAARVSEADERSRHHGTSHHSEQAVRLSSVVPLVPTPRADDPPIAPVLERLGLVVTTMGRGPADDPAFFAWAAAAGAAAANMLP
ncbi:MAG: DUF3866 family protein [Acidimicrobiales bacterium]